MIISLFYHASVELANQIADSQVDKSTYHTQFDKLFTSNHGNGTVVLTRSINAGERL